MTLNLSVMRFKLLLLVFIFNLINVSTAMKNIFTGDQKDYGQLAEDLYNKGNYGKARSHYTKALKKDSENELYLKKRGFCNAHLQLIDDMEDDVKRATDIARRNGSPDKVLDYRVVLCDADIPIYGLPWSYGNSLSREGRYEEALHCYDRAIKDNPRDLDYYAKRGNCHCKVGNWSMAWDDFKKVTSDSSACSYIYRECRVLGEKLFELGNYNEAIEATSHLRTINDVAILGSKLFLLGRFKEALRAYTEAILKDPKEEYYRLRGICYTKMESLNEALEDFEKAVEKSSSIPEAQKNGYELVLLGAAQLNQGKIEEAMLKMKNFNASQLVSMGDELVDFKKSLLCYNKAIEMYPKNYECYLKRGLYFKHMNDLSNAISDFRTATEIEPSSEACWIELAEALVKVGNYNEAKTICKGLNPTDEESKKRIETARGTIEKMKEEARLEKLKSHP